MTPTITVKQKADKRVRIINLSDFDDELHDVVGEKEAQPAKAAEPAKADDKKAEPAKAAEPVKEADKKDK